jgi:Meiotically up-regulated gene 113
MSDIVYVIQCAYSRRVKIGRTRHPVSRFRALLMTSPTDLRLLGILTTDEAHAHLMLSPFRLHGEWFEHCDEVDRFLERFMIGHPVALAQIRNADHLPTYLLEPA